MIPCKVEYYSSLKSSFEDFCEFSLSEMDSKWIELDNDRVSAEIWRIKIPQLVIKRDSDDDDEEEENETGELQFKVFIFYYGFKRSILQKKFFIRFM